MLRCLCILIALLPGQAPAQQAPFSVFHHPPDVTTSASGEAIWFGQDPASYEFRLPQGFGDRHSDAVPGLERRYTPSLGIHCRRSGSESQELRFSSEMYVQVVIPRLERDPTAALAVLLDPRYFFYELTGRAVREVPLEVSVDAGPRTAASLRIHRTDYAAPRPPLYAYLPARPVLERVAAGSDWTLEADGEEAAFTMRFAPAPAPVRRAAREVLDTCAPSG